PYAGDPTLVPDTREALAALAGEVREGGLDFAGERALLDRVHGRRDELLLERLHTSENTHRGTMVQAAEQTDYGRARELIRGDDSRTLLVHARPETLESPYGYEGFSFQPGTLMGRWERLQTEATT